MELNFVMTILDRDKRAALDKILKELGLKISITMLCRGTARPEHLLINNLAVTEKAVVSTVAGRADTRRLMMAAKLKMYVDIPGNGIMLSIPIKSVGGGSTLAYLAGEEHQEKEKPKMEFSHELIYAIFNEGHSEDVMEAARPAGAAGGTVISAKGTGMMAAEKFLGISLADEKEVVMIVARAQDKAAIMRAIIEKAGVHTKAGAICFSLPVSSVAGIRRLEEDKAEDAAQ